MRVLLADDNALVRQGLISILSVNFPHWSYLLADSLAQAMNQLDVCVHHGTDVELLVVDLHLPGMRGSANIRTLREIYKTTRIAVLTGLNDRATILKCLGAGAHGYLLKAASADEIVRALHTVMAGAIYVPPWLSHVEAAPCATPTAAGDATLTALTSRQKDVLRLLDKGQSTKSIARSLNLGVGTVKVHLSGIYRNLGARNRTEAVARSHGIGMVGDLADRS